MSRPPRAATRMLARVLRDDPAGDAILGDLLEDFVRTFERRGRVGASVWYWKEALGLALSRAAHGAARSVRRGLVRNFGALIEDAGWAVRMLRRSPGFALFTACVIGLGVGAVTTVFSVIRPLASGLPFEDAHQLVWISNVGEDGDRSLSAVTSRTVNLMDFRERASSFQGITGYDAFFAGRAYVLGGPDEPERLVGVGVAHDFLDVLGVVPHLGRGFTVQEGQAGAPAAVLLSHGFWRSRFAGDPSVVGRDIFINDTPRTVVGVLPERFDFSSVFAPGAEVDVLVPFVVSEENAFQGNVLALIGRLRPGVTPEAAHAELEALVAALGEDDPERWGLGADVVGLRAHLAGPFLDSFLLLAAAAGTLLLLVCANVSSLLLARSPGRRREMAVRKALGAPRRRLVRQLLLETVGISAGGAAVGGLVAWVATEVVRAANGIRIPLLEAARVDGTALGVAAGAALLTGVVVGVVPALRIGEGREADVLRAGARGSSATRGAQRLREILVVTEVTLACVLLVVGGLLLGSFRAVLEVDLGFDPDDVVAWQLQPSADFASRTEESAFWGRVAERVRAQPGIGSVGLVDALPLGRNRLWSFRVIGVPDEDDTEEEVFPHVVEPGYLPTMRISPVAGRTFTDADGAAGPHVVILNETAATRIFGGPEEALGRQMAFWGPWTWEVVGVVRDVRHLSPEMGSGMEVYFPLAQMPDFTTMDLVVRSSAPPTRVAAAVSSALQELDPGMPSREFWTLEETVREATSDRRFALGLLFAFGLAALLLAGLGIYGVLSQTVADRRPEIGIRMALGASPLEVASSVIRRMLLLTAVGVVAGWVVSSLVSSVLGSLLFGVDPVDPRSFIGAAGILVIAAALGAALPARRAVSTEASKVLGGS